MDTMRNLSCSKDLIDRSLSKIQVGFPFEITFFTIKIHEIFMLSTYYMFNEVIASLFLSWPYGPSMGLPIGTGDRTRNEKRDDVTGMTRFLISRGMSILDPTFLHFV